MVLLSQCTVTDFDSFSPHSACSIVGSSKAPPHVSGTRRSTGWFVGAERRVGRTVGELFQAIAGYGWLIAHGGLGSTLTHISWKLSQGWLRSEPKECAIKNCAWFVGVRF